MPTEFRIRPARRSEWPVIRALIQEARLDPTGLAWSRFLVAESATGQIIGCGQVRHYPGRSIGPWQEGSWGRELGSLVVASQWQRRGVGAALVRALQAQAGPPLYLVCVHRLESYYVRFGFQRLPPQELPWPIRAKVTLANTLLRPIIRHRIIGMGWFGS